MKKRRTALFNSREARDAHKELSILVDNTVVTVLTVLISGLLLFLSKDSFASFDDIWPLKSSTLWLKTTLGLLLSILFLHYLSLLTARRSMHLLASGNDENQTSKARRWNDLTRWLNRTVDIGLAVALLIAIYILIFAKFNFQGGK